MARSNFCKFIAPLALCAALSSGLAQAANEQSACEKRAARATSQGDYSSAIAELSNCLSQNPLNQRVRIQLAAAYAGRAGLPLQSFIGLGRELINTTRDVDRLFEQRVASLMTAIRKNMKNKAESQTLMVVEQVYVGSLRLATLLRQFEAVPIVRTEFQFEDLNQAIFVLQGDQNITGGGALYRGLLRVAALRYRLEHDIDKVRIKNCKADLTALHAFVNLIYQESRAVLVDLSLATLDPGKRAQWEVTVKRLDDGAQNLITRLQDLAQSGLLDTSDVVALFDGRCH